MEEQDLKMLARILTDEKMPQGFKELADVTGTEAALRLCAAFGGAGERVRIPQRACLDRIERNRRIARELLKGRKTARVSVTYRLSASAVRGIRRNRKENTCESSDAPNLPKTARRIADAIGMEATRKLIEEFDGDSIYIPSMRRFEAYLRNLKIHEAYYEQGKTIAEIAREQGLTRTRIHQILNLKTTELRP